MSVRPLPPSMAVALLRLSLASRERDLALARQLTNIERMLLRMADQLQMLTAAVNGAVDEMQSAIDELAAHPVATDDPAVTALITKLQNATSALSTSVTQHGQTLPAGTSTGADGNASVSGANSNV